MMRLRFHTVLRLILVICITFLTATTAAAASASCSPQCLGRSGVHGDNMDLSIFYFVQVHNERTLHDAVHLLRAIRHPRNQILIHVDVKAENLLWSNSSNPLLDEIKACPCRNTIRVDSKFDVQWSHWSMNAPTLWALQVAVREYMDWDVWINLSGDTLPVYTQTAMAQRLSQLPYNFVTSSSCETGLLPTSVYHFPTWWHKRRHYTQDETVPDFTWQYYCRDTDKDEQQLVTQTVVTHFGSQWVILQHDFCQWLVDELEQPDSRASQLRDYLEASKKLMTDETFLPTLIMHAEEFRDTLPKVVDNSSNSSSSLAWKNGTASSITHVRYERMDENIPTAFGIFPQQQRYQVPEALTDQVEQPRAWGPYFLGTYDLGQIRTSGALFVRKVSERIDANMVRLLPVHSQHDIPKITWPNVVSIADKPDWNAKIRALYAERMEESDSFLEEENEQERSDEDENNYENDEEL